MSLLRVENVSKYFGSLVAVNDVSMIVAPGELRAVIGPNGAGKTTFFNLITGFFRPSAGRIVFEGDDITALLPARRVWRGIARTFQITEVFPELTVHENLRIPVEVASGFRLQPWLSRDADTKVRARVDELLRMSGLAGKAGRLVGELAHGDQRATEIMMAIALNPRLLLLDEPTAGMGEQETLDIIELVRRLHKEFETDDRADRARHARGVSSGRPHHGARSGQVPRRRNAAGDRRQRSGADRISGQGRMTAALTAEGLHTYYGKSHILHGVSLEAAEGQVTALLGRNGAGKTTTLRSLMGLTPPREGKVTIFGQETTGWPPFRVAALGVGYVPEGRKVFPNLTVEENLKVPLERPGPWTPDSVYRLFPRLKERRMNRGRQLSGGEQEMLSIARALLINPKLLILDEPSQGLAPLIVREVFRIVAQMRAEGITVLLVEQNVHMSLEIADHAYVLDDGHVVYSGPARELAADAARVQSLAGASADEWSPQAHV